MILDTGCTKAMCSRHAYCHIDEARIVRRSGGAVAGLKRFQLRKRSESFGKREVQNLVLL